MTPPLGPRITDPDVLELAGLSATLSADYIGDEPDPWIGSPFAWIRQTSSSRRRGAIAEKLVSAWFALKEFDVVRSHSSDADRVIEGHRVEIKMSTPWDGNMWRFQQLRNQEYDYLLALGIAPLDAQMWLIPKDVLLRQPSPPGISPQHGGSAGRDTYWLGVEPGRAPAWMSQYGGRLGEVVRLMRQLGRGPH